MLTENQHFLLGVVGRSVYAADTTKTAGIASSIARRLAAIGLKAPIGAALGGLGGAGLSIATGGIAPLALIGGGAALGSLGGIARGILQRPLGRTKALKEVAAHINDPGLLLAGAENTSIDALGALGTKGDYYRNLAHGMAPMAVPALGGVVGYSTADDGNKLLGTGLGIGAGALLRPLVMRNLLK